MHPFFLRAYIGTIPGKNNNLITVAIYKNATDPAITLQCIYPTDTLIYIKNDLIKGLFIAAAFVILKDL